MRHWVGTSGYNYVAWKGLFYPAELPASKWLPYYAGRFPAVEINYTFYRVPTEKAYDGWAGQTPAAFRFAIKASQRITHRTRLKETDETTPFFCERARRLGDKLGPVLFQLPPNLKKDVPRLAEFLPRLPAGIQAAFEFRHPSWFDDETYETLRQAGASLCIADSEDLATPFVVTAPFGYLRLRRQDYDESALDRWAGQIRDAGWTGDVHVYFKHEDEARGPRLADALIDRLGRTGS